MKKECFLTTLKTGQTRKAAVVTIFMSVRFFKSLRNSRDALQDIRTCN